MISFYRLLQSLSVIESFLIRTAIANRCTYDGSVGIYFWQNTAGGGGTTQVTYTRTVVYQIDTVHDVTETSTILPPDYTSSFNEEGTRIAIVDGRTLTFPTGFMDYGSLRVRGNLTIPGSTTISESSFSSVTYASSPQPPLDLFTKEYGPQAENLNGDLKGIDYQLGWIGDSSGYAYQTAVPDLFTNPPIVQNCYSNPMTMGGPYHAPFTEYNWLNAPSTTYMDLSPPSETSGATPGSTMVLDNPEETDVPASPTESESGPTPSSPATKLIGRVGPLLFASCLAFATWCR